MVIKILNFKHVGLKILLYFIMLVVASSIPGPQKEVVSIYNDNFTTPASRPQYFIEVYRCVNVSSFDDCDGNSQKYPLPNAAAKIEIMVPDITNSRDSKSNKFYKYVLYNHTSCDCGPMDDDEKWKLYRSINSSEVSETDFKKNYAKNPVNLIRMSNACAGPQPRYKLYPQDRRAIAYPQYKFLPYEQCLPVCVVENKKIFNRTTSIPSGGQGIQDKVLITNDKSCQAYDGAKIQATSSSQKAPVGNSSDQDSNYEILVYISSAKVILAAFLLSLILFTILIMDITLCRRKKGLLYALVCCRKDDADLFCQDCNERKRNEISV